VVDEKDGDLGLPLQQAKAAENSGDFGGSVLVDSGDPDERVKDEQSRLMSAYGSFELPEVLGGIQAKSGDIE
jgi:hypothetical protein